MSVCINTCGPDLSGFRVDEVEERPDSSENQLFAPGTQTLRPFLIYIIPKYSSEYIQSTKIYLYQTMDRWSVETHVLGTAVTLMQTGDIQA